MAIDNLNYYSSGLPAGQLTDKYSSQPGCLKSKNLDIFSSSKSVKATAWSNPTTTDADIVAQDSKGHLVLKTDGKVYEDGTLFIDPSTDFPVYDVCYTGPFGTYASATRGTSQDMVVKYDGNEWKSFVVYTDRSSLVYSKEKFVFNKSIINSSGNLTLEDDVYDDGYLFRKVTNSTATTADISIRIENAPFTNIPVRIFAKEYNSDESNISLDEVTCRQATKLYYDAQLDGMAPQGQSFKAVTFSGNITVDNGIELNIPVTPNTYGYTLINLKFKWTPKEGQTRKWNYGELYIDINGGPEARHMMKKADGTTSDGDCNYYYSYLPLRERKLVDIGAYGYSSSYWMKGQTFQPLYKWASSWIEKQRGNWKIIYDFITDIGWESDPAMDIIGMVTWNEQVYMIGNLDGDGYIIPCDLTGGRGTPFIAYGCEFKGVTNIDYLLYLVGEDRGISTLWVFNQQELVPVLGGRQEVQYKDRIGVDEQYKFDGKILNRRKNLILSTTDNRIFQYGQTYGGKGGAFIHELTGPVTNLKTVGNDLVVDFEHPTPRQIETWSGDLTTGIRSFYVTIYSEDGNTVLGTHEILEEYILTQSIVTIRGGTDGFTGLSLALDGNKLANDYPIQAEYGETISLYSVPDYVLVKKSTTYQDDTPIKNYNTERQAVYPIVLGNHLLEKEESDLYASYILPASSCKLEFWGMANHYHFWTFTSEDNVTLNTSENYKLKGFSGTYNLKFIEKNGNQYTFRLEGDLPVQITNEMKITMGNNVAVLTYSDFNHFRRIGMIETDKYCEGEFRFHNLNNKLELPKSYSLQIMVKGKGTVNYTPELFSVDLVVNQRERG